MPLLSIRIGTALVTFAALFGSSLAGTWNVETCDTLAARRNSPQSGDCGKWTDWKCSTWIKDGPKCSTVVTVSSPPSSAATGATETCDTLYARRKSPQSGDCGKWTDWKCSTWIKEGPVCTSTPATGAAATAAATSAAAATTGGTCTSEIGPASKQGIDWCPWDVKLTKSHTVDGDVAGCKVYVLKTADGAQCAGCKDPTHWNQQISMCVPTATAGPNAQGKCVTEVGSAATLNYKICPINTPVSKTRVVAGDFGCWVYIMTDRATNAECAGCAEPSHWLNQAGMCLVG